MKIIKCMFCSRTTSVQIINAKKKIKGKIVTLSNAPVYYCEQCNETFTSKEVQDVFRYIQDRNLDDQYILFNYEEMLKKL